jgi:hypothetical protein
VPRSSRARQDKEAAVEKLFPPPRGTVVRFRSPWLGGEKINMTGVAVACVSMGAWFLPIFAHLIRERFSGDTLARAGGLPSGPAWAAGAAATLIAGAVSLGLASRALRNGRRGWLLFLLAASAALDLASAALHIRLYRACSSLDFRGTVRPAVLAAILGVDCVLALAAGVGAAWMLAGFARRAYHPARPSPLDRWRLCCTCSAALSTVGLILSFISP